jgi:RimJ/RimL family protein N-acetyltransferase
MLKGQRLKLRLISDIEECRALLVAYNDVSQRAATDHTEIKSWTTLRERFVANGLWDAERGTLLITTLEDHMIGEISFTQRSTWELEIGYRIFVPDNRGQGYLSEALPLFSAYLFATRPIGRLRIQTAHDNVGSRRVAEKSGYRQEGVLRRAYFYRGRWCDGVIYGLLREESPVLAELMVGEG